MASAANPAATPPPGTVTALPESNPAEDADDPADWEVPEYPEQGDGPEEPTQDMFDPAEEFTNPAPSRTPKPPFPDATFGTEANPDCKGQYGIRTMVRKSDRYGRVGPRLSSYFADGGVQKLSSGISGEISASVSTKIAAKLSALTLAEISGEFGVGVQSKTQVSASYAVESKVGKKRFGNAYWGVKRVVVNVKAYYLAKGTCKRTNLAEFSYYAPQKPWNTTVGWCLWSSKASWGSRPAQCNDGSGFIKP